MTSNEFHVQHILPVRRQLRKLEAQYESLKDDILDTVKESKCLKCKSRAKKAHRIKRKKNPYSKYSYNSGLCKEDGAPVWDIDIKWFFWELENGGKTDV